MGFVCLGVTIRPKQQIKSRTRGNYENERCGKHELYGAIAGVAQVRGLVCVRVCVFVRARTCAHEHTSHTVVDVEVRGQLAISFLPPLGLWESVLVAVVYQLKDLASPCFE